MNRLKESIRLNAQEDEYVHSEMRPYLMKYIQVHDGKKSVVTGETAVLQNLAVATSLRSLFRYLKRSKETRLYDVALANKEKDIAKGMSKIEARFSIPYMSWYLYDIGTHFVFYGNGRKISYFYNIVDDKVTKSPSGKLKTYAEDLESYAFVDWCMTELCGYAVSALGD